MKIIIVVLFATLAVVGHCATATCGPKTGSATLGANIPTWDDTAVECSACEYNAAGTTIAATDTTQCTTGCTTGTDKYFIIVAYGTGWPTWATSDLCGDKPACDKATASTATLTAAPKINPSVTGCATCEYTAAAATIAVGDKIKCKTGCAASEYNGEKTLTSTDLTTLTRADLCPAKPVCTTSGTVATTVPNAGDPTVTFCTACTYSVAAAATAAGDSIVCTNCSSAERYATQLNATTTSWPTVTADLLCPKCSAAIDDCVECSGQKICTKCSGVLETFEENESTLCFGYKSGISFLFAGIVALCALLF